MTHDFKKFPELTNNQLSFYYFDSPHRQITDNFLAEVIKVTDGDTIRVRWTERDFDFPVRFINIAAPESNEEGGEASQSWLEQRILGEEVEIIIDPDNRVEKWGRLLGEVTHFGMDIGEESIFLGHALSWSDRGAGKIPDFAKELAKERR